MMLQQICATVLNESSTYAELSAALNSWVRQCSALTGIHPDPSFDAWAEDSLLAQGVAINPSAAAHCALDVMRSVIFIRGIHAAIKQLSALSPNRAVEILYAGCGPYGTLLLPLLTHFNKMDLTVYFLDIHQASLDSVNRLLSHFGLASYDVQTIEANACAYQHTGKLDIVIAETMQKALEQEPQFAVTANFAAQLNSYGVFIPERIDVRLCIADLASEKARMSASKTRLRDHPSAVQRQELATLCTLTTATASEQMRAAQADANSDGDTLFVSDVIIPTLADISGLDAALFTRIGVFERYVLDDYASEITLPLKCHELTPLQGGDHYRVSYEVGRYPRFNFQRLS